MDEESKTTYLEGLRLKRRAIDLAIALLDAGSDQLDLINDRLETTTGRLKTALKNQDWPLIEEQYGLGQILETVGAKIERQAVQMAALYDQLLAQSRELPGFERRISARLHRDQTFLQLTKEQFAELRSLIAQGEEKLALIEQVPPTTNKDLI